MPDATPPDDLYRERDRRQRRGGDDVPASRPDNEVPANRREDPRRHDRDDEQERRERRGS
jgi:hypothetical protein